MAKTERARQRRPWEAPDCPNGHSHVFVDKARGDAEWTCFRCDESFDGEPTHEQR